MIIGNIAFRHDSACCLTVLNLQGIDTTECPVLNVLAPDTAQ